MHVQSLYDADHFPQLDINEKEAAEAIRDVSLPPSKSGRHRQIGDQPGGLAWGGPHKGTGFDPKPNKEEWKVRQQNRLCTERLAGVGAGLISRTSPGGQTTTSWTLMYAATMPSSYAA